MDKHDTMISCTNNLITAFLIIKDVALIINSDNYDNYDGFQGWGENYDLCEDIKEICDELLFVL